MKAILVLDDMPKSCRECPFGEIIKHYPVVRCMRKNYIKVDFSDDTLPKECPLKEMPKRKEYYIDEVYGDMYDRTDSAYVNGWNACLEELEK